MPTRCICYTTDPGYLFPTLVSASQARRHASAATTDVVIFSFGADAAAERVFRHACDAEGVRLVTLSVDVIDGAAVMLARLFLTRFVPAQYEQLLYIDGDTQVRGALDPLLDIAVPAGRFLAANDPMAFAIAGPGAARGEAARHIASLGISLDSAYSYFNTGVLRINRRGWERIGLAAWELFRENPRWSRFPDQDVLNVVGGDRRIPMSLAWNFPIFMRNSRVEASIRPRIHHFMSAPKPWQGSFPPWGEDARAPYLNMVLKYPELARFRAVPPARTRLRYQLQQRYKKLVETFTWGFGGKRERILEYERALAVPAMATAAAAERCGEMEVGG